MLRQSALAASFSLLLGGTTALAGSVLQPGGTVGLAAGAPFAEGVYFIDTTSYGQRTATPTGLNVNLTQVVWATPIYVADTRLQFIVLEPTNDVTNSTTSGFYLNSTLAAAQLAHAFGNGFDASYQAGYRTGMPDPAAYQFGSFEQRGALTYDASGFDLTANVINGLFYGNAATSTYPDWLNVDLTATRRFGSFELGAVAFGSGDLTSPTPAYRRQRQIAVGGLAGYDFRSFKLQLFATRDVAEHNYTGYDTRGWVRVNVPLYKAAAASQVPLRERF